MADTIDVAIRKLEYVADTRGLKEVRTEVAKLDAAQDGLTKSTTEGGRAVSKLDANLARLEARIDREVRLAKQLARDQALVNEAYEAGAIDVARYERLLGLASAHHDKLAASANRATAAVAAQGRALSSMGGMLAGLAGFAAFSGFTAILDSGTRISNALKVAGLEGEALSAVYDKLYASAQRNAAPMEALVELYGRASQVQNELGISTEELLGFTDRVAVALRVSGRSARESSGALLQLSQALGAGTVRAEEFNSILEGALPIAQAAAAGLDEAGGSVAKLRQMVVDGEVSSKTFFNAFLAGSTILETKVAGAQATVSQGFDRLQNTLTDTVTRFNEATGTSAALGGALLELSYMIDDLGSAFERGEPAMTSFFGTLGAGLTWLQNEAAKIREALGIEDFFAGTSLIEGRIGFASQQGMTPAAFDDTFKLVERSREVTVLAKALADKVAAMNPVKPISATETNIELATTEQKLAAIGVLAQGLAGESVAKTPAIIDAFKVGFQDVDKAAKAAGEQVRKTVDIPLPRERPDRLADGFDKAAESAANFGLSAVKAFTSGQDRAQAMANTLSSLSDSLADSALRDALSGNLASAAVKGIGAVVSGIFGRRAEEEAERRREEKEAARQVRELAAAIREMGHVGGDLTNTLRDLDDRMQQLQKAARKADRDIGPAIDKINELKADAVDDFTAKFDVMIASLKSGAGFASDALEAANAIQTLGASIEDFLKDAKKAGLSKKEAKAAGAAALLATFTPAGYEPPALNPFETLQAENKRLSGQVDLVINELMDIGFSGKKATAMALGGLATGMAQALEMYMTTTKERQDDWTNRLLDLQADTSTLDGQLAEIERQYQADLKAEKKNGGEALVELEAYYGALRKQTVEDWAEKTAAIEKERLEAAAARQSGYLDRLFAATNDDSTLAGALAAFDREAARQRAEEVRAGGEAMLDLDRALATERLNVIKDFNEKALEEERSAARSRLEEARADLRSAYDAEASAINRTIDRMRSFVSELGEFRASLRLDQSLSILSPEKRYLEAQRQFRNMQLLASAGDEAAQAGLTRAAQSFLTESRSFNASNSKYASDFLEVERAIGNAAADAQNQLSIAERQLVSLDRQVSELITINDSVLSVADAIRELRAAMGVAAGLGLNLGGRVPGFAMGGMIGNGIWNQDSVLARYAGGGAVAVSGGEYLTRAPSVTPATLPVLQQINRTGQAPSIDVTPIVQAVISASQAEMATTREEMEQLGRKFDNLSTTIRTSKNATPRPGGAKLQ